MKLLGWVLISALGLSIAGAQAPAPVKKRLLAIGAMKGFQHDSVPYALATMWRLGKETGLWETYIRTDTELITKKKLDRNAKNLDYFDAVYFYTTGELDLDDEQKAALLAFVKDDGKGFIGGHSSTDTLYKWPEYGEMIGGYFDQHPWHQAIKANIEDTQFPGMRQFGPRIELTDEIYQLKNFSRDQVRVLMTLDTSSVDMTKPTVHRTDGDFALAWAKNYGKGRVFATVLGHENQIYDRPDMRQMYTEAIKWALGLTEGDATPRPKPAAK